MYDPFEPETLPSVPQAGLHADPPAVMAAETPALVGSPATVMSSVIADAPAFTDENLFVILTVTASAVIVKLSGAEEILGSVTDVATIVGVLFGAAGADGPGGGVYVALVLGEPIAARVPQAGEHAEPFAVSAQVTPAASLVETFRVTAGAPAAMVLIGFVMVTPNVLPFGTPLHAASTASDTITVRT